MGGFNYKPSTINYKLFNKANRYLAGGVNSPVRSFKAVGGCPVFINLGRSSRLFGEYGASYIDYCLSWGALILGHAHPEVVKVAKEAIDRGSTFGAVTKREVELAEYISGAIPSIEKVRLTNSGTEAVMGAVRLARAYTGKKKIIKFEGSYHGHADYLLECEGIPRDFTRHTLVCPYNNIETLESLAAAYKDEIAAVIVEPVAGNMGVVLPKDGFLKGVEAITRKYNIILIFDEVITGFRLSYGGAQGLFKINPDMTCLGKIIGGGFACGAFGGRSKIMNLLSPQGPVYQAGTFSGNPVSVNAGITTLKILSKDSHYQRLAKATRHLCDGIAKLAQKHRITLRINSIGSMFTIFFTDKDVINYNTASSGDRNIFKQFYHGLLKEGVYLSPSGLEANFVSIAHTQKDIDFTLKAVDKVFKPGICNRISAK